jgi:indole-3-glycerol phosphate synthase
MNLLERLTESERLAHLSRQERPLPERRSPVRPFLRQDGKEIRLIAEYKRSSPSHGPFPPQELPDVVRRYTAAGAAAISILVAREGFAGRLEDLVAARDATDLPLLYKGFVSEGGQLDEAYAFGADAVLLIAAVLGEKLGPFIAKARTLGLAPLVEVHREEELVAALAAGATLIGINNRDLASLACDPGTFLELARRVPPGVTLVAESGYRTLADIAAAEAAGAAAVLVGEALLERGGLLLEALAGSRTHVG